MVKKSALFLSGFLLVVVVLCGMVFPANSASKQVQSGKSLPRLVDVGADKCVPCIMMAPILEELKKEYAGVLDVVFVDAWKNPTEARKYRVRGIPTQIFYDASGKERARHMGYMSKKAILGKFKDLGIPLGDIEKKGK